MSICSALGDLVAKTAGVISTPYKVSKSLSPQHRVLVLASDGLWDFVPNEEVVAIASQACDARTAAVRCLAVRHCRVPVLHRVACWCRVVDHCLCVLCSIPSFEPRERDGSSAPPAPMTLRSSLSRWCPHRRNC
jgi:hypothetical protein